MARLGLIGISTNSKRRSGVYSPEDNISYKDAIENIQSYTVDGVGNALSNTSTPNGLCFSKDGTKLYTTANTSSRTTASIQQYNLSAPFNLSTITYSGISTVVGDYDINPTDLTISDDGTKLFFTGFNSDSVWSGTMSTPYDLSTFRLDVKSAFVGTQDVTPQNIYITSNPAVGLNTQYAYVVGNSNDTVYQYSISNWDISTASLVTSKSVTANFAAGTFGEATPRSVGFNTDGTVMFILGETNDAVLAYDLSSPWNVSTANPRVQTLSVTAQDTTPIGLHFKPDGRSLYVVGSTGDDINQYNLSTPWDLTTASFVGVSTIPSSTQTAVSDAVPSAVYFKQDDGTKMFVMGQTSDLVREYSLSVGWAVTSRIAFTTSFSVTTRDTSPTGLAFNDTGTKMFVAGQQNDNIIEYSLGTAWDISNVGLATVGFTTSTAVSSTGEASVGGIFFGDNGYKLYVCGSTLDSVRQFNLINPYDVSSSSFVGLSTNLFVGLFDATPYGVGLSTDGTKLFFMGGTNDRIWRVGLSSAWNVDTCTAYKYVGTEEATSYSVGFSTDGTSMYVTGGTGSDLNQYTLSTAWDISTAKFTRVATYPGTAESTPIAITFKPDGSTIYVVGQNIDTIKQIDLNTPWDISSMSSVGIKTFSYPALNPAGIFFKDDGTEMYATDITTDTIKEFSLSTPWDISTATGALMLGGNFAAPSNQLESAPRGLNISPDGNYLFFCGNSNSNIRRITLSSPNTLNPGDINIYNTVQSYTGVVALSPSGIYINPDGKTIYVNQLGLNRRVFQVKLSTPFDLSTASLSSNYIAIYGNPTQLTNAFGIALSNNQDRMFVVNDTTPFINQYSLQFL